MLLLEIIEILKLHMQLSLLDSAALEHGHHGVTAQLLLVRKIKPY